MSVFTIINPTTKRIPIVVSVPHCGVQFPEEIRDQFIPDLIKSPDDTDWFVDELYDFAPSLGITTINAVFSRWVIDLNRDPESKPLYSDGRIITGLCPTGNFLGEEIYKDRRTQVNPEEVARRIKQYYTPYHEKIQELLNDLKLEFGSVLLWDCHSIRQFVPTIHQEKFSDLILGDAEGAAASPHIIEVAYKNLGDGVYSLSHNYPFMGGYITRHFGKPLQNQQALQLEMTKINYMDDSEKGYDQKKAETMKLHLRKTFTALHEVLMH